MKENVRNVNETLEEINKIMRLDSVKSKDQIRYTQVCMICTGFYGLSQVSTGFFELNN